MKNLNEMTAKELKEKAKELKVANWWNLKKSDLIKGIEAKLEVSNTSEKNTETAAKDEPMKMSETINTLEHIFDVLNNIYFDDSLPKAMITVQSTPKAYGHCTTKKIWKAGSDDKNNDDAMYEINLGAEYINRPIQETAATLNHEMVHLYCIINDIADTCQNGRYHNKTFKAEAEARDLITEYDRANGFSHTKPTEEFTRKLTNAGIDISIKFARTKASAVIRRRNKQHKYTCPICGQYVKSASELHISCTDCGVEMECL